MRFSRAKCTKLRKIASFFQKKTGFSPKMRFYPKIRSNSFDKRVFMWFNYETRLIEGVSYINAFPVGEPSRYRCSRSAGACPPRCASSARTWRGTGPRPTVTQTVFSTVARGPVPRDVGLRGRYRDREVSPTGKTLRPGRHRFMKHFR